MRQNREVTFSLVRRSQACTINPAKRHFFSPLQTKKQLRRWTHNIRDKKRKKNNTRNTREKKMGKLQSKPGNKSYFELYHLYDLIFQFIHFLYVHCGHFLLSVFGYVCLGLSIYTIIITVFSLFDAELKSWNV